MTNKVGIGVEAQFDTSAVERALNTLGSKIAAANKVQFNPISGKSMADLQKMLQQFEQLRKIHGDLNKRMNVTGQGGASLLTADFEKMYPDPASRARVMRKIFEHSTGAAFGPAIPPPSQPPRQPPGGGGGGGRGGSGGSTWGQGLTNVAQAGLRAAGPAGGVAAGALGTGMSAGFGAGLMGLVGGLAALGVGKFVSAAMEKVGDAENNAIALDRLKRTLGDVNVSFAALKAVVHSGADNLKITYSEAEKLATQFTRLGNVSADQYKTIADEMNVGVGMSRAFGMDPSQGVGALGQMRGLGVTSNTQESRRFALLIGETIGKAGAFAKADEVMDALTNYTTAQTRQMLGRANTQGYAGMFAGLVSSGIPGLDPTGAAGLIGRVNAALTGGGAKGEASQFFSAQVGASMGLDPIQTMMLREGGAFATNDSMFGKGSAYARFMGGEGPEGGSTFLSSTLGRLRGAYGNNKGMLAMATANHLGIGINQAMGLLSVDPAQMGEMEKYANLSTLSGSGIGNLSKSLYGSESDRMSIAQSLLGREDLSAAHRSELEGAVNSGTVSRDMLARLTAQYEQERTQGSDIRDSKNALDNLKTNMADKVIPYLNEMRHGIMHIAGVGKGKTSDDIMREVINADSEGRARSIRGRFSGRIDGLQDRADYLRNKERSLDPAALAHTYRDMPEVLAEKLKERAEVQRELVSTEEQIKVLETERAALLKKENERRAAEIKTMEDAAQERAVGDLVTGTVKSAGAGRGFINPPSGGVGGASASLPGDLNAMLAAEEKRVGLPSGTLASVIQQETGGKKAYLEDPSKYHYPMGSDGRRRGRSGLPSSAFGPFGILEDSTAKNPGYGVSPLQGKSIQEQARFAADYLAARTKAAGSLRGGLAGYGEGYSYADSVLSRIGTPLPAGAAAGGSTAASGNPGLSGEVNVNLGLTSDAARLLRPSAAPIFTRLPSNWRPSMGY